MSIIIKGGSSGDLATVKPASTAPIATDTSLVVTMSPNSPAQSVSGTVTANAGTNLNTSLLALEAGGNLATVKTNTDNLALAQASSTSGQKGNLILGAVTTAAPSYTTAQSNPLSLTTAGALRIDGSAVTQPISGTVTVNALTNASVVKAQLQDNSGNGIGSISSAGINNLAIALGATNYVASTVNSSTAQLAASATFTGTVETTFNQQSYSILMVSDQPMTINLFQYIDAGGTKLASTLTYTVLANAGFAQSGVVNGNFFKISAQNTGAGATTTFQIDTAYGTIPSATKLNNGPVSINEVNGTAVSLGQTTMAASFPVTLASNQASIPVAATLSAETTKVIGTINVAAAQTIAVTQATAANLNVTVAALTNASIVKAQLQDNAGTAITLGQKVMASSVPVALASDQSALTVAQATAANLNATIVQATAANLNAQVVGNVANAATDSGNPVKVGGVFQTTIPALTAGQRGDIQLDSRGAQLVSVLDGVRATYSASATNIVPAVTATDVFTITGSATKTVRVIKIGISGVQTAGGIISALILKRSTANSAGTSAASTAVPNDSNNAAATATVLSYTANPTLGTTVGSAVRSGKIDIPVSTAATTGVIQEFVFGDTIGQAVVLRGIAQVLAINLNSVTVTGGSLSYYVVWTEE